MLNLIDGKICTAINLTCGSTSLGDLSQSSQVSKAQIYAKKDFHRLEKMYHVDSMWQSISQNCMPGQFEIN